MAGVDKEESVKFFSVLEKVTLRFGSTRWLTYVSACVFFWSIAKLDATMSLFAIILGGVLGAGLLVSLHFRPHSSTKSESQNEA